MPNQNEVEGQGRGSAADARRPGGGLERAIDALTRDHDEVRGMLRDYKALMDHDAPGPQREALAARICNALTIHATIEETIFYPAARAAVAEDAEDLLDHAEVEHGSLKNLIATIESSDPDDPLYDANVHVLGEYVAHHVQEEEDELFSELRQQDADFGDVAQAMQARRDELMQDVEQRQQASPGRPARASQRNAAGGSGGSSAAPAPARKRTSRGAARKGVKASGSSKSKAARGGS